MTYTLRLSADGKTSTITVNNPDTHCDCHACSGSSCDAYWGDNYHADLAAIANALPRERFFFGTDRNATCKRINPASTDPHQPSEAEKLEAAYDENASTEASALMLLRQALASDYGETSILWKERAHQLANEGGNQ